MKKIFFFLFLSAIAVTTFFQSTPQSAKGRLAIVYGRLCYKDNNNNWITIADSAAVAAAGGMVYPGAGIAVSNGSGWITSITEAIQTTVKNYALANFNETLSNTNIVINGVRQLL